MNAGRSADHFAGLVHEMCKLTSETERVELNENNDTPHAIREYISTPSNAAAIDGMAAAYDGVPWRLGRRKLVEERQARPERPPLVAHCAA
jgi:hypothetical protein